MKTLILLRHANSSWKDDSLNDFDRPLKQKGITEASSLAKKLIVLKTNPDLIVCSPAKRTRETLQILFDGNVFKDIKTKYEASLYLASVNTLLSIIRESDDSIKTLMLVGHNPGINELYSLLSGEYHYDFPNCCYAEIAFNTNVWKKCDNGKPKAFIIPE